MRGIFMSFFENCTNEQVELQSNKSEPIYSQISEMQIGTVKYIVKTTFNKDARETAEQKLLRVITNQISNEIYNSQPLQYSDEMAESLT